MPRPKTPEPRTFLAEHGQYPFGPFIPETPLYALAAALFAWNVLAYMDGTLSIMGNAPTNFQQDPNVTSLLKKADASAAVMSRILNGVAYPDMTTIAKLEAYTGADLWGTHHERMQLLDGNYNPSRRQYRS